MVFADLPTFLGMRLSALQLPERLWQGPTCSPGHNPCTVPAKSTSFLTSWENRMGSGGC